MGEMDNDVHSGDFPMVPRQTLTSEPIVDSEIAAKLMNIPRTSFRRACERGEYDDCRSSNARQVYFKTTALGLRRGRPVTLTEVLEIQVELVVLHAKARNAIKAKAAKKLKSGRKSATKREHEHARA